MSDAQGCARGAQKQTLVPDQHKCLLATQAEIAIPFGRIREDGRELLFSGLEDAEGRVRSPSMTGLFLLQHFWNGAQLSAMGGTQALMWIACFASGTWYVSSSAVASAA
jgi:hypothetical protein